MLVKIAIKGRDRGAIRSETLWVRVTSVASGIVTGTLANAPILESGYYFGCLVSFAESEIIDTAVLA